MTKSPHQIISVDDSPADTKLLKLAFDQVGEPYSLKVLADGETAIRFFKEFCGSKDLKPCLIIIDLHLPRFDGVCVLNAIRRHPDLADVGVAVLTSLASPEERRSVFALGVDLYRNKPMAWSATVDLARELFDICNSPRAMSA